MVLTQLPKPPVTTHDKKRHGHHHKASKHYAKTYWPYLPMLLIVALGFVVNAWWGERTGVLGYATAVDQTSLLQETNIQRSQHGRSALALNGLLNQAAQEKANDMAVRNYWSHVTPEGAQPWQFISVAGYSYLAAGENLAYGFDSSAGAIAGWMNSASHRENLLNAEFQEVGFGIANHPNYQGNGEQTIIVAMYATPPVAGAVVTQQASSPQVIPDTVATTPPVTTPLTAKEVSRIGLLTNGNAQWAILAVSVLATIGTSWLIYRHGRLWHTYLVKGEQFAIRHPVFDIVVVIVIVVSALLTRTTGIIH